MPGQSIRPSQFILTYGVGSLIEAPTGPRIIPEFDKWSRQFSDESFLRRFEIRDPVMSSLLDQGLVFSVPTNADLGVPDERSIFRTVPFPAWGLCHAHQPQVLTRISSRCPVCRHTLEQLDCVRFIRACPSGHLDDVDWTGIVHAGATKACRETVFEWRATGSELGSTVITCGRCNAQASLSDIYNATWSCSGLFPENGLREVCKERASVLLRNSSNLRVARPISTLTIPPRSSSLHNVLGLASIFPIVASQPKWTKADLLSKLHYASQTPGLIDPNSVLVVEQAPEAELLEAIEDMRKHSSIQQTYEEVRQQELHALKDASAKGAPPKASKVAWDFEVDKNEVRTVGLPSGLALRVTPVRKLRVIAVQRGYYRPVRGGRVKMVERFLAVGTNRWYPGVELRGEGIFLDLPHGPLPIRKDPSGWLPEFFKTSNAAHHPIYVWWHTLAHRIITALGIDSGYSSASLRERIYFDPSNQDNSGILVSASQTGGDGTMGGLIALVSQFERVLDAALINIHTCSNDPLCMESTLSPDRSNGAACYACLLLSETSCEFLNSSLDRNLLRLNI